MTRLGSTARPAVVRVHDPASAQEILALCHERGWQVIVGVEPDQPEDLADLAKLLNPTSPARALLTPGRNEPCSCGSGKKYKKCHGA
jgi:SWIM/SEC-C metal-binding protein